MAQKEEFKYKIGCLGAGYVGGPTMAIIAQKCPHIKVIVGDISQRQVDRWNCEDFKSLPIYEPHLEEIIREVRGRNLFFTTDLDNLITECTMIFVSVNTPTKTFGKGKGRAANLKNWELAARHICRVATSPKIVIEKSTLPVRTAASMKRVLDCNERGIKYQILSNPEFLAEGTAIKDLTDPSRVLIGGNQDTKEGRDAIADLVKVYANWVAPERILTTNLWSSELTKLAANAMLAQRISSVNSLSALCEETGADISEVSRAMGMDPRIGAQFLNASVGFGGSCFQKDILNLVYLCESYGLSEVAEYWAQVVTINDYQKRRFAHKMMKAMFNTIAGKKITVLGFAFKKNTGDTRESAAIFVTKHLLSERAKLSIFDPKVEQQQIELDFKEYHVMPVNEDTNIPLEMKDFVTIESDPYEACKGAHAIAVMTEWDEFSNYDYQRIFDSMSQPAFIFDGRNILDHAALRKIGFDVYCIGKPSTFSNIKPVRDDTMY